MSRQDQDTLDAFNDAIIAAKRDERQQSEQEKMARVTPRRQQRFTEVYNRIPDMQFDPKWGDGTGYFNNAIGSGKVTLKSGELRSATTPNGRRMIFIGTHLGTVAIFDRYTPEDNVFVFNMDKRIERGQWLAGRTIDDVEMFVLLGALGAAPGRGGIADIIHDLREVIIDTLKLEKAHQR